MMTSVTTCCHWNAVATRLIAGLLTVALFFATASVRAVSVGFEQGSVTTTGGVCIVGLAHDFTDQPILGGLVNITYDATHVPFVGFAPSSPSGNAELATSPAGVLPSPGLIGGFG